MLHLLITRKDMSLLFHSRDRLTSLWKEGPIDRQVGLIIGSLLEIDNQEYLYQAQLGDVAQQGRIATGFQEMMRRLVCCQGR